MELCLTAIVWSDNSFEYCDIDVITTICILMYVEYEIFKT
jgi:hypothetical protein